MMKRWVAFALSLLLLFLAGCGAAEEDDKLQDTAEIQESVITDENSASDETEIRDLMKLLIQMAKSEELKDLLNIREVQELVTEGTMKVTNWLVDNPTVAVKVLLELGVPKETADAIGVLLEQRSEIKAETFDQLSQEEKTLIESARKTILIHLFNGMNGINYEEVQDFEEAMTQMQQSSEEGSTP